MSTYPFVAAAAQYGPRKGPVKAFVVHLAEGGGTVGFLAKPNARGVSVHYVIEYTGRIVQMVKESDASGSINPNDLRTTDDPAVYGATVRKQVMGDWDHDPNSAVITCEVEGFAKTGPNAAEHASLKVLIDDVRSRFPGIGLLGHRDFQDYKPCPGKLVHWDELGGHGPQEDPVSTVRTRITEYDPPRQAQGNNVVGYLEDGTILRQASWSGLVSGSAVVDRTDNAAPQGAGWLVGASRPFTGYLIPAGSLTVAPAPPPDCSDAVGAQREKDRVAALAAIEGVFA